MTARELIKIISHEYTIFIEDLTIVKQLLINELPQHSTAINSCKSWKELLTEVKPYMEMVETSVGKFRCIPNPTLIINPIHISKYLEFEVKRIDSGNNGIICIFI
jgi:hypothetical protein